MLTISAEDEDVVDALMAGASGYLLKDAEPDAIVAAARAAAEGEITIATSTAGALVDRLRETARSEQPGEVELTDRERDVLALIVEGHDNTEIARRLFVSPSTVKSHVSSILEKFDVDSRVQAAVHAVRSGMV
jgi:DNA-binding NarL/FixJ family response regulator